MSKTVKVVAAGMATWLLCLALYVLLVVAVGALLGYPGWFFIVDFIGGVLVGALAWIPALMVADRVRG